MKAVIDREGCISCEVCVDTCGEVFRMADDGIAEVYVDEIPADAEASAAEAAESCPTDVITIS